MNALDASAIVALFCVFLIATLIAAADVAWVRWMGVVGIAIPLVFLGLLYLKRDRGSTASLNGFRER